MGGVTWFLSLAPPKTTPTPFFLCHMEGVTYLCTFAPLICISTPSFFVLLQIPKRNYK